MNGATVLNLRGELDVASVSEFERELADAVSAGPQTVIMDLSELEFMDSTGLRAVLVASESARGAGYQLALVQGGEQVRRLFSMTRVEERLHVVASLSEALGQAEA